MSRRARARLAVFALLAACATSPRSESAAQPVRIAYGADAELQYGELLLPEGAGPFPLAVVIHGGCWRARFGSVDAMEPLAEALAAQGVASWNIEYRRVGNDGGGWPGTFLDIANATDYVKSLATDHPIDVAKVIALGHSAGGHLALWAAARAKLAPTSPLFRAEPLRLRGVVALAGPADLRALSGADTVCGRGTLEELAGGTLEAVPDHYAQASPAALLPLGVPQLLITGSADRLVPTRLLTPYERAAQSAGDRVALSEVPGANHRDLIRPDSDAWPVVRDGVRDLLR